MKTIKKPEFNCLPREIILMILDWCSFNSKIKFFSTCQKYRYFSNFHDLEKKDKISLYRGYIQLISGKLIFIFDNLHAFSGIRELVLETTCNTFGLYYFKLNLPTLKRLRLISPIRFFLTNLSMPRLMHLDIAQCEKCVLDDCDFPMLTHLYIRNGFLSPLRFCKISIDAYVLETRNHVIEFCSNFGNNISKEKIDAQILFLYNCSYLPFNSETKYFPHDETTCSLCQVIFDIISEMFHCPSCNSLLFFTHSDKTKFRIFSDNNVKCPRNNPMSIYMDMNGFGNCYCYCCGDGEKLSKLAMCALGKIKGMDEYPLIN